MAVTPVCMAGSVMVHLHIWTRGRTTTAGSGRGPGTGLAPMPVLRKQVEEGVLGRVLRNEGFVEGDAEPQSGRQWEAAIRRIDLDHAGDGPLHPGIGKVVE